MVDADEGPSIGEVFCGATIGHWKSEDVTCTLFLTKRRNEQCAAERKEFLGGNGGQSLCGCPFLRCFLVLQNLHNIVARLALFHLTAVK